jgi:hypothetical protein
MDDDFEDQLLARRTTMAIVAAVGSSLFALGFVAATVVAALYLPFDGVAYVFCVAVTAVCAIAAAANGANNVREARALMRGDVDGANQLVLDGIEKARRDGDVYGAMAEGLRDEPDAD